MGETILSLPLFPPFPCLQNEDRNSDIKLFKQPLCGLNIKNKQILINETMRS